MLLKPTMFALATACALMANSKEYYQKELVFPVDADSITKIDMASRLVPSPKQLAWQQLELTAFLHFGINTFTGREWGDGKEDPKLFNPEQLDAHQWVKILKDAGFKLVILTAKHHDGFCLWPTATTEHSVASSNWRDGKGDVMRELKEACDAYDMKLGVYLSPWDRNASCYGDSPRYNDMFVAQLTELLTQYGTIDEVWFDGACGEGPNGKKQEYDWDRFKKTIEELQPNAVMAIMGDDVRWVGNERGMGRETEWSATALTPGILPHSGESNEKLGLFAKAPDLGGRHIVAQADRLYWWPSEVDVSIRPGWFYTDKQQPKPLRDLVNIYLNSVGRNSVLLLNIPPDTNGLIAAADAEKLQQLNQWVDANLSNNLTPIFNQGAYYAKNTVKANSAMLREDISKGQRVESFTVEGLVDGNWTPLANGTTIGYKRIVSFPDTELEAVRLVVNSQRAEPMLLPIETYCIDIPAMEVEDLGNYALAPTSNWTVMSDEADAKLAIDGNPATHFKTVNKDFAVNLGETQELYGFVYTPRADDDKSGTIFHYHFYTSEDGENWVEQPTSREFSNIVNNPIEQKVFFNNPVKANYIKLEAIDEIEGGNYFTIGNLGVLIHK